MEFDNLILQQLDQLDLDSLSEVIGMLPNNSGFLGIRSFMENRSLIWTCSHPILRNPFWDKYKTVCRSVPCFYWYRCYLDYSMD